MSFLFDRVAQHTRVITGYLSHEILNFSSAIASVVRFTNLVWPKLETYLFGFIRRAVNENAKRSKI